MKPDISKMSLREKIGQVLLVRQSDLLLRADKAYDELRDPSEAKEIMDRNQFGGLWTHGNCDVNQMSVKYNDYFAFTSKSYVKWLNNITADMKIRPIFASDTSAKGSFLDMPNYVTGLIIGATNSTEYIFELGQCIGKMQKAVGARWIWSPNIDLMDRFSYEIGRVYTSDIDKMIAYSTAFMKGLQSVGVAATAKHFPGKDLKDKRDAHIVAVSNHSSLENWKKGQGAIYQALIDNGIDAIMPTAIAFPAMDDRKVANRYIPAGYSDVMLTKVLKEEMGFEGVIISDDVTMGGWNGYYEPDEVYARLLAAGHDMLLGVDIHAVDTVEKCVERGILSEERIDDACRRVLNLKEKVGIFNEDYCIEDTDVEKLSQEVDEVVSKIARVGITLVRDNLGLLPVKKNIKHVTIFTYTHREGVFHRLTAMKEAFEKRGASVVLKRRPESFEEVQEAAEKSDLIIYAGYLGFHAPKGIAASFFDEEFWAFRYAFTAGQNKSMGISLGYPFIHHYFMDAAETFVNLYNPDERVQEAFVAAVYGEIEFKGQSPVELEIHYED